MARTSTGFFKDYPAGRRTYAFSITPLKPSFVDNA
jgi:hypothetical protein